MTTVLTASNTTEAGTYDESGLWMSPDEMEASLGWTLKPEGLCQGDVCVPVPPGREAEFRRDGEINAQAFWQHMGKTITQSEARDVWFFGDSAADRTDALMSLQAPDFTLPDFNGKLHSLTDFRRQRVLLITWASW